MKPFKCNQKKLLNFTLGSAMLLALSGCQEKPKGYVTAPPEFSTNNVTMWDGTNAPPTQNGTIIHAQGGNTALLYQRGYYPIYNHPGYYYYPAADVKLEPIGTTATGTATGDEAESHGGFGSTASAHSGEGGGEAGGGHGGGGE